MKKIMVIAVGVFLSTLALANGKDESTASSVAVMNSGSSLVKVFYKAVKLNDVKVSIRDERNQLLFSETLKKTDGFMRPYNFENLPAGQYSIQVEDQNGKQMEKIDYGPRKAETVVNIVKVQSEEGRYLLTGISKGADNINVRIYNSDGKTIYEEARQVNGEFIQKYNLKDVKGSFSIEVSDSNGILKNFGS